MGKNNPLDEQHDLRAGVRRQLVAVDRIRVGQGLTGSSSTATGLPTGGRSIYATLWLVQFGARQHANATYIAAAR
jgi:hypothetical protein